VLFNTFITWDNESDFKRTRFIAKRYAECRGTDSVLRTLALLLATHSRATPKQAKEPKILVIGHLLE